MAVLSYLQIFLSMFTCAILYFLPGVVTYKMMAMFIAGISSVVLLWILANLKRKVDTLLLTFFLFAILIFLYYTTASLYGKTNEKYNSFFLVLAGQIAPTVLCAIAVAQMKRVQYKMKQYAPYVGALFTFISFTAAFFPDSATSGGFVATESGLNYQTTSYLAAYAAAFNLYFIVFNDKINWIGLVKNTKYVRIYFIFVLINFLSIMIAGGRGGLLLFLIQAMFAYGTYTKKKNIKFFSGRTIQLIIAVSVVAVIGIAFASSFGGATNGFSRIVNTVENQDENGRDITRGLAILSFLDSPIWGHGFGSVFYELGKYSHNCITDALVETGVIGCLIFVTLLIITWRKTGKLMQVDLTDAIWRIVYLDGLVMSFFSGYYLGHIPIYWIMGFALSYSVSPKYQANPIIRQ